jgi:2-keto-4-pentenoate hydratase
MTVHDMPSTQILQQAADRLWDAQERKETCEPVRDLLGADHIDAAYAVQAINRARRLEAGDQIVGRKIGLTSSKVQAQLGVDQPDFGDLYSSCKVDDGADFSVSQILQPKIEAEIAFVLKSDLNQPNVSMSELAAAIDYALISLEIVGSRISDWNIRIADTVADNASASHFVLGSEPAKLESLDMQDARMEMHRGSELVSSGKASDCMDSPLNAALWLAKTTLHYGNPLQTGDVLLTGALGPMVSVEAGDQFRASIEGLGSVSVNFVA